MIMVRHWEIECTGSCSHADLRWGVSHAWSEIEDSLIRKGVDLFERPQTAFRVERSRHEFCEGSLKTREFCTWIQE